jgi:hypothetical protein
LRRSWEKDEFLSFDALSRNQQWRILLRWREKVIRATKSADCAEIGTFRKIGCFTHFGEIGE